MSEFKKRFLWKLNNKARLFASFRLSSNKPGFIEGIRWQLTERRLKRE